MSIKLRHVYSLPIPLKIDFSRCQNVCNYCHWKNGNYQMTTLRQIENAVTKKYNDTLMGYFLENRYPISFNTESDFFALIEEDKKTAIEIIKLLHQADFPLLYETKGYWSKEEKEIFLSNVSKKDGLYVTITSFDEEKKKTIEPKTPSIQSRIDLIDSALKLGFNVCVGFAPIINGIITEKEILDFIKTHKNCSYFFQYLHANKTSTKNIKDLLSLEKISLKEVQKYMYDNNIYGYCLTFPYKNLHEGERLRKFYKKPIIITRDLENSCKKSYDNVRKMGLCEKEFIEHPQGYRSFEKFCEENKENIIECIVDRSELYLGANAGSYFYQALPKKMTYKDYLKVFWMNPQFTGFTNYESRIVYLKDEKNDIAINEKNNEPFYFLREQPFFIEKDIIYKEDYLYDY